MTTIRRIPPVLMLIPLVLLVAGCSDRNPSELDTARATIDPVVFAEEYGDNAYPQPFSGTDPYALSIDSLYAYAGDYSLKLVVPPDESALGAYAGGVLTSISARDFTDFNAMTFWARSDVIASMNEVGFGNDNTGTSLYSAGRYAVTIPRTWVQVVIPIPDPSKLIAERGLFTFSESFESMSGTSHTLWFDEIKFEKLDGITNPRPAMTALNKQYFVGSTAAIGGTETTFDVNGVDVTVGHSSNYFDFTSSNADVAVVEGEEIRVAGTGDAFITGKLGDVDVDGVVVISGSPAPAGPAPVSGLPASDVVPFYSDVYGNHSGVTWNSYWQWSTAENGTYRIGADESVSYSFLNFVGITFNDDPVDASGMTHFHLDVYAPEGTNFKILLVSYDENGFGAGQTELTFDATTTPAFTAGGWSSLDIPVEDFVDITDWSHIGQLVLSTDDAALVLVDNIYWHK